MSYQEPLSQTTVAISISDSPDMPLLGLAEEHLRDAMVEVARHMLAMGARLAYGGDLRKDGFTELLYELVARHRRDADVGDTRPAVLSFLPWPVHRAKPAAEIQALARDLQGLAELHCLDSQGGNLALAGLQEKPTQSATNEEWSTSLTSMRRIMTDISDVRIVLGGRIEGFRGQMPGIAEEAICTINVGKPLYILGGFGGCARSIAENIGLVAPRQGAIVGWSGLEQFSGFNATSLNNGLSEDENTVLARTVHIDEAVALILRGLLRLVGGALSQQSNGSES